MPPHEGPPFTTAGTVEPGTLDADLLRSLVHNGDTESTGWVVDGLANRFTSRELDASRSDANWSQGT